MMTDMKRIIFFVLSITLAALAISACVEVYGDKEHYVVDKEHNGTFHHTFVLQKVLEKDPVNVNGLDILNELEGYESLSLKVYYVDDKITALEFTEGEVPYTAYGFAIPEGKVDCYFDTNCFPNAVRLKSDDSVIAYYKLGQFFFPYQLDCSDISYEYWFK